MKFRNMLIKHMNAQILAGGAGGAGFAQTHATAPAQTIQATGQPVNGQPANIQPANGQPVNVQPANAQPAPAPLVIDNSEYEQFKEWKRSQQAQTQQTQTQATKPNELSAFDRLKLEQEKSTTAQQTEENIRASVAFDMGFDSVINGAKNEFNFTAEKIREYAKGLQGDQLVHTLKCTAVKDYFSNEKKLDLLTDQDRAYILDRVMKTHDNNVDSSMAWDVLQRALHISKRLASDTQYRTLGGGDKTDAPNIDAYLNKQQKRG